MKNLKQYINGKLLEGEGENTDVFRPADGQKCGQYRKVSVKQAIETLNGADAAFETWGKLPLLARREWMHKLSDAIKAKRDEVIELLIDETGKVYEGAAYDCDMLFHCLDYFPNAATSLHGEIIEAGNDEMLNMVIRKPIGVVVAYLAWNFPLLNVAYKIGPALASGCTIILKPSSKTPLATLLLGEILEDISFPPGVINIIAGSASEIGPVLSGSPIPSMITMIGSTEGGLDVIKESATTLKKYSLELGGNAPVIVMADADIKNAAAETAGLKFSNCGQICVAPNRVYVHEDIYDDFLIELKIQTERLKLGWGRDEDAWTGPLIVKSDRDKMFEFKEDAVKKGAKVLCGGEIPDDKPGGGNWFTPCVIYDANEDMRACKEEIFGPLLPVLKYCNEDDIAEKGNSTEYGLAAYLFTNNLTTALEISRRLDFGSVSVNKPYYSVELPHGGFKQSGVGKDCSHHSLEEYYSLQRISIAREV